MKIHLELFGLFFKIGAFTFGGGYAMIPLIEKEIIEGKEWVKKEELMDLFAVAQSIPGAIAINTASLVGYKLDKKRGAFWATAGVLLPSFIIITVIAMFFTHIAETATVGAIFLGINGCVIALILATAIKMMRKSVIDKVTGFIFLGTVIFVLFIKITPIYMIVFGALIGLLGLFRKDKVDS